MVYVQFLFHQAELFLYSSITFLPTMKGRISFCGEEEKGEGSKEFFACLFETKYRLKGNIINATESFCLK